MMNCYVDLIFYPLVGKCSCVIVFIWFEDITWIKDNVIMNISTDITYSEFQYFVSPLCTVLHRVYLEWTYCKSFKAMDNFQLVN